MKRLPSTTKADVHSSRMKRLPITSMGADAHSMSLIGFALTWFAVLSAFTVLVLWSS